MMRSLAVGCVLVAIAAGQAMAQRPELTTRLTTLEAVVLRDSSDPVAHYEVGIGYWMDGRLDDAERHLRRAVEIDPQLAVGYLALAYLPVSRWSRAWKKEWNKTPPPGMMNEMEEARRNYRRAFMVDPLVDLRVTALAGRNMATLYSARGAYLDFLNGLEQFRAANYFEAYRLLDAVVASVPEKRREQIPWDVYWYRGLAAAHTRNWDTALADLNLLLARAEVLARKESEEGSPLSLGRLASIEVRYVLATVEQRGGRTRDAARHFEEVLASDLGMYMAHVQLARIHERNGAAAKAIVERRRALAVNPEDASLQFDLGVSLARSGEFSEAQSLLTQAMAANPHNARIPYMLGLVREQLGDAAGARAAFDRFLAIAPSSYREQIADIRQRVAGAR
jgi:Tfp pilus assembly protein PilF